MAGRYKHLAICAQMSNMVCIVSREVWKFESGKELECKMCRTAVLSVHAAVESQCDKQDIKIQTTNESQRQQGQRSRGCVPDTQNHRLLKCQIFSCID